MELGSICLFLGAIMVCFSLRTKEEMDDDDLCFVAELSAFERVVLCDLAYCVACAASLAAFPDILPYWRVHYGTGDGDGWSFGVWTRILHGERLQDARDRERDRKRANSAATK